MALPKSSIPSFASYMSSMKMNDPTEKALMVRIGALIDAIVASQRGSANAGSTLSRRSQVISRRTPPLVTATTENILNGVSVSIDPLSRASDLSNYEVQLDSDPDFKNPTIKMPFNVNTTFKGLTAETIYYLRARALTKTGVVGPWSNLDSITTTASTSENNSAIDGTLAGISQESIDFSFNSNAEDMFVTTNFGLIQDTSLGVVNFPNNNPSTSFYLTLYMDTEPQEKITLEGIPASDESFVYDTVSVSQIKYWPLCFFTLIEPADAPSTHTFSVKDANGLTDEAVVYVKF